MIRGKRHQSWGRLKGAANCSPSCSPSLEGLPLGSPSALNWQDIGILAPVLSFRCPAIASPAIPSASLYRQLLSDIT
jgi:hypothetical protein